MTKWIPLTEGKPVNEQTYWITDGKYICLADTYSGGLSIKDWMHVEAHQIAGLSYDGVEDFQLMKRVTHYAEFEPMSVPELPNKTGDIMNEWISVKDRLPINHNFLFITDGYYVECMYIDNDDNDYVHTLGEGVTHWMPMPLPKPPIQVTVNLDEDVADIREERICKNCRHFTPFTKLKQDKNQGDCKKIGIANGMELFYDDVGSCTVRKDFGCNQWQKKDEITHYTLNVNTTNNGILLKPATKMIDSFTNFHTQKIYGYHKGKPVYLPYYIEKQMEVDNE